MALEDWWHWLKGARVCSTADTNQDPQMQTHDWMRLEVRFTENLVHTHSQTGADWAV